MKNWLKQNKLEVIVILLILLVAAGMRFYHLSDYMTFLGDEGRDALLIKKLLVEHDLPFIGPPTSVGNIYLGPLYYYMMAFSMAIFWLNPIAAAGMIAFIGVATVGLVYYLSRRWFGFLSAVLAATLYTISPVNIIYSRSSWNPNPAPFFALLAFLGLYQARQSKNFLWFILTGAALAAAIQMHYLALILLPIFTILWSFEIKQKNNRFLWGTLGAIIAFFLLILPLILFDFKHNFMNYQAMSAMFFQGDSSVSFNFFQTLSKAIPIYHDLLIGRYLAAGNTILALGISFGVIVATGYGFLRVKSWPYRALLTWLVVGVAGLTFYKQEIYDHYLGFLNPAPYLLLGGLTSFFKGKRRLFLVLSILMIVGTASLLRSPLRYAPNAQLEKTQEIAKFVILQTGNKPFNFALLAERNYDAAYQFYLDIYGHKPAALQDKITDQLFVVCEDPICNPVGHPKFEIAGFGWAEVSDVKEVLGVKVYKLVHKSMYNSND